MIVYIKLIFSVVIIMGLIQCCASKQNNKGDMINDETKIIMQTKPDVILQIEGNKFLTTQKFDLVPLNNIVKQYNINVKPIESKVAQISNFQIFQLFFKGNSLEVINQLLEIKDVVDGAYEKKPGEDPAILEE